MNRRNALVGIVFAILAASTVHAGKKVYVGANVPAGQQVSMDRIDHRPWDAILKKYVDKNGQVNYKSLKASANDSQVLDNYIQSLSTASTSAKAKREAQLAYWINAYNAVTVKGILREYPTSSIKNHVSKLGGYDIWNDLQLVAGGRPISLNDIEHKVLRKMNEPRIHFAIVCASIGCPRLLNQAYTAEQLNKQLEVNASDFFSRKQNFQFDEANRRFHMSALLDWFGGDFGSNQQAQMQRIAGWLPTENAKRAAQQNAVSVKYLDYDWNLNERKAVAKTAQR